jgi:GGDEF domain-containing protein
LDQTGKLSPERQQFYQNESRKLMEEDAASRPAATDPITGYGLERERSKAVMEAVRQQGETGQPATYVDMDITNHEALRRSGGANEHVKGMMQVIETELRKLSPDAEVFRHSGPNGDEFSAVVPGVDEAAVQKAIATAREKLGGYAKKNGLADLAHTKEGRGAGVGVEFGTAALKAGTDPRQSVAEAERQTSVAREGQLQPGQKMPVDELRRRLEGGEDIPGLTKAHAADLKALILEGKTLEDAGEERGVRRQAVNQSIERALEKLHGLIEEPEAPTVGAGGQRESVLDLPNQWRENPTHEKIDDILNNWVGEESRAGRQLSEQESAAVIKWKKRLAGPPGKGRRRAIKEATDFLDAKAAERAAGEPAPVQAAGGEPVPAEPAEPPAPAGGQGRAARSAAGEAEHRQECREGRPACAGEDREGFNLPRGAPGAGPASDGQIERPVRLRV